ncbi:hypothetical protein [Saccharopolyspora erythraea]|uniref:hypothetical protein n=1 Tax=Saccharopolyspora erythraea TaxID=1836 RepID=UPI001E643969|nr:hypothetical protein [Saccharopolyspora erythraea]
MSTTVSFSKLLREPNEVVKQLDHGDVLLSRRDGESLRLSKAGDAEREVDTLQALAQLIAASLDEDACDRIVTRLTEPFPWVTFLPADRRREFVSEFLRVARACASIGRFERLTITLNSWRATAEAYADPSVTPDGSDLDYLPTAEVADDPRETG